MKTLKIFSTSLFLFFCIFFNLQYCSAQLNWISLDEAKGQVKNEKKILLVLSGAQGGVFLNEMLINVINTDRVAKELSSRFVLSFVSSANKKVFREFNIKKSPTILFLTYDNGWKEIERILGYVTEQEFISVIRRVKENKKTYLFLHNEISSSRRSSRHLKMLAEKCIKQEKFKEAKTLYKELSSKDEKNKDIYAYKIRYIDAVEQYEKGNTYEAIQLLKADEFPKARAMLSDCYIKQQNYERAAVVMWNFLKDYPQHFRASAIAYQLVRIYITQRNMKSGVSTCIWLIKNYKDSYYARQAKHILQKIKFLPYYRENIKLKRNIKKTVYIVPDMGSFLFYISKWTDKEIFPVFMDKDNHFTKKFIETFKPNEVIETKKVNIGKIDKKKILQVLYASWTENDVLSVKDVNRNAIRDNLKKRKVLPVGIVFVRLQDMGLLAGVSLACARDQLINIWPGGYEYEQILKYKEKEKLRKYIRKITKEWEYPYESLYLGIDYLTFSCDLAYRYYSEFGDVHVLDTAVNRDDQGDRFAFSGRLLGDQQQKNYQAMCSLFLKPKDVLFFNTYNTTGIPWKEYQTQEAAKLIDRKLDVGIREDKDATLSEWQQIMSKGNEFDMLFVNSSGGKYDWQVKEGKAYVDDIPDSVPTVVYFTHSGSAADPQDADTIAGRWLKNGAYVYYGAVTEPYVQAFNPSAGTVEQVLSGETYGFSFRKHDRDYSHPWKIIYVGDPLASLKMEINKE
ncbi:MAG: hypothetical protein GY853_07840 [PVC group bacterium]|nr:hypothetical protein [PVC group bacterium]